MNYNKLLFLLCIFYSSVFLAQEFTLHTVKEQYPFINWKANELKGADTSPAFKKLYKKLNAIAKGKDKDVHIFHIGGSHIQADIYSNRLRTYLQNMNVASSLGQRGFVFPYKMAKTNNPSNYTEIYTGAWKGYRCSIMKDSVAWGMAGITTVFKDSVADFKIKANHRGYKKQHYDFNKIRIFYNDWKDDYEIFCKDTTLVRNSKKNKKAHYIEYELNDTVEEIDFCIRRKGNPIDSEFLMMGLELMNDNHGVQYTSIGVNGASFDYYNRCVYFEEQFKLYKPDLFIVSVGTNDAYYPDFDPDKYRENYEKLIRLVKEANPDCAVLLTVPNDSYYKRKYPNPRTRIMQKIIYELSEKYNMAVWDFYEIMGGFNASQQWYKNKLMPSDRIHFTQLGYRIKADLLLEALTDSWEKTLNIESKSILNQVINE